MLTKCIRQAETLTNAYKKRTQVKGRVFFESMPIVSQGARFFRAPKKGSLFSNPVEGQSSEASAFKLDHAAFSSVRSTAALWTSDQCMTHLGHFVVPTPKTCSLNAELLKGNLSHFILRPGELDGQVGRQFCASLLSLMAVVSAESSWGR